ncbi:LysR family transcriptional regulator [Leucobacter weissii]|uniref:LysR family transcriptional regulator n=1 Tax=Leucobacter weissii TaxID=1983706 RepID=A0A939MIV1_9MICO|nr:LysR substrate-binding domain-containing protein [Leucobacter weissii]MBO1901743.1 LysR family transcriptional regulator [Leucobacter weissii]
MSSGRPPAGRSASAASAPEPAPLRLGFVRGIAPGKWARRWHERTSTPLELIPFSSGEAPPAADVLLERAAPGARPAGAEPPTQDRHAVRLYTEEIALVVAAEHEVAEQATIDRATIELIELIGHPDHAAAWPPPGPRPDPAWAPADAGEALEFAATGTGGVLLPLPLARHLAEKGRHAVLRVEADPPLAGTSVWATWDVERDADDVQRLVAIMRGRTARSSRASDAEAEPETPRRTPAARTPDGRGARRLPRARSRPRRRR